MQLKRRAAGLLSEKTGRAGVILRADYGLITFCRELIVLLVEFEPTVP